MKNWNTIQIELTELNSSLAFSKLPEVYSVPEGYFENFAQSVLQKIEQNNVSASEELETLSPLLAGLSRQMPYTVPQGYFSEISSQIPGITSEEVLPEILVKVGKSMPYAVPADYFESLPSKILAKITPVKQSAKVISFGTPRWMRYAAAAMMAGVITISSIFFFRSKNTDPSVHSEEWVAKKLKNVSNQELEEFINTADISDAVLAQTPSKNKTEVRTLLNDVPDSELEKFLNDIPMTTEDQEAIN